MSGLSGGSQYCLASGLWEADWDEVVFWIKIVFAGLVNHPHQVTLRSWLVCDYLVQLSQLK